MHDSLPTVIVWFRKDLRIADNPAFTAAIESSRNVIPVFIFDEKAEGDWIPGKASLWWLHHALVDLKKSIKTSYNIELVVRKGDTAKELDKLILKTQAEGVFWNRRYEPAIIERDKDLKKNLQERGLEAKSFNASLLNEPWTISNKAGTPFKVFTPYWKHCSNLLNTECLDEPTRQDSVKNSHTLSSLSIDDLGLLPTISWDEQFYENWAPTEQGAKDRLEYFIANSVLEYDTDRDRPDFDGTSKLSPYLAWGQISPRQIAAGLQSAGLNDPRGRYMTEIGWREFSYHLLFNFPETVISPLNRKFEKFPHSSNEQALKAWQTGNTGYPIVDAGMRQLWETGWMHNRVRMIVASFLVKHLLLPWQEGANWFWDTLVDADLANNTMGWQWSAGCGADAAPFFRIFNPILQGAKFDPKGTYTKHWVPELKDLPTKYLFAPDSAPDSVLNRANIQLGTDYPEPIISHFAARNRALEAYQRLKAETE